MAADLMRRAVIDAQCVGPAPDIDAERLPGERLLKDPLPEITSQEQPVRTRSANCGQEAQLGDTDILCLIDDGDIEGRPAVIGDMVGQPAAYVRPGNDLALHQPA